MGIHLVLYGGLSKWGGGCMFEYGWCLLLLFNGQIHLIMV